MSEPEQKGFKVVDKRGLPDEERAVGSTAQAPPPPRDEARPGAGPGAGGPPRDAGARAGHRPLPGEGPSFLDLVGTLQFGALASLGMVQAPDGKRMPVDLDAAKDSIDMLGVLQEKTKGNLTEEESEILAEGLYHIRMAYVAALDAAAGPGGKKT